MNTVRTVVVGSVEGHAVCARLPLYTTIFGIEAVVIPAEEYARLLDVEGKHFGKARKSRRIAPPSRLDEEDPEVAAFIRDRLAEGLSIWRIEEAARRAFDKDRAPKWGVIRRYRLKVLAVSAAP